MRCLILFSFLFSLSSISSTELSNQCIRSSFSVDIDRPGSLWGLVDYDLNISKNRCIVTIQRKNLLKSKWEFDVCREPIHIKLYQYFTQKDLLKEEGCGSSSKSPFCLKKKELLDIVDQEGLVHVKGEREVFSDDHGKIYCLSRLMKKYLGDAEIFSMSKNYEEVAVKAKIEEVQENEIVTPVVINGAVVNKDGVIEVVKPKEKLNSF